MTSSYASNIEYLAYKQLNSSVYNKVVPGKEIDLGRYRTQDGIGICYNFTFIKRLENLCKTTDHCDLGNDEINALHLYKITHDGIPLQENSVGGHTSMILDALKKEGTPYTFYKESCAPFDQMIYKRITQGNPNSGAYTYMENQEQGLIRLKEQFNAAKNCADCIPEIAKGIKEDFKNIKGSLAQIELILENTKGVDFKIFSDVLFFQLQCRDPKNHIKIEPFKSKYASTLKYPTIQSKIDLTLELLNKNITPELAVCNSPKDSVGKRTCGDHAILINGHRKRCNSENICKLEFKVFNSWGKDWQDENNDGWVDAENLFKYVLRKPKNETDTEPRYPPEENYRFIQWFEAN